MTDKIWSGDFLNRQEDADFLIKFLLQQNENAVQRGRSGISVNVSAPWGAGKTYFLTNMARQLTETDYKVAEVNAWRDDHAIDPMFAVISPILKALGKAGAATTVVGAIKKNFSKIAIHTGIGLASRAAGFFIGKAVDEITREVGKALTETSEEVANEYADDALKSFEEGQTAIDGFRESLAKAVEGGQPLFVLIDELDRCKPTYAVALLERVKHLFDVPNVIFVVATHTDQLAHTIKAVYGEGFDAERYLLRFFDRTYTFDRPKLDQLIKARWSAEGFAIDRLAPFRQDQFVLMGEMADRMGLWPRDVHQVLAILWSVAGLFDHRLPIPALFAFPLIAAYQQRQLGAFHFAMEVDQRRTQSETQEYNNFFNDDPIISTKRFDRDTSREIVQHTSTRDFMNTFRTILSSPLTDNFSNRAPAFEYGQGFRAAEIQIVHGGTIYHDVPIRSVLIQLGPMIKKAGRLSVGKPAK